MADGAGDQIAIPAAEPEERLREFPLSSLLWAQPAALEVAGLRSDLSPRAPGPGHSPGPEPRKRHGSGFFLLGIESFGDCIVCKPTSARLELVEACPERGETGG